MSEQNDIVKSPQIEAKIRELEDQVGQYKPKDSSSDKSFLPFKFTYTYLYIGIPIVFLIFLFFVKPRFLMMEITTEEGEKKSSMNYSKLFLWSIILGMTVNITIFIIRYKRKPKEVSDI